MGHLNTTRPLFPKRRLRRRVTGVLAVQWMALTGLFVLFCFLVAPLKGLQGWLAAAPVLGVVHWVLWKHLAVHSPPVHQRLFFGLGAANMITVSRGWLISVLAGIALIAAGKPGEAEWIIWLPGLCYLAIGCGDFCDGLVARLTRTESLLGKRLDISMDALGLLVASAAAVFLKRLPPAFLLVGLSYYLFQLGLTHRRFRGKIVRSLADRPFGRAMAGVHMGFVGLALIPAFSETLLKHAAILFMVPLLLGFVWDWLVVTGRLGDEAADRWGCFSQRSGTVVAGAARLVILLAGFHAWQAVFAIRPSGAVVWVVLWCMMASGWLGRSAAVAGAVITAATCRGRPPSLQVLVFDCMVVLIITGTGRGSLWRPEDILFRTKIGADGTPTHSPSEGARTAASLLSPAMDPAPPFEWPFSYRSRGPVLERFRNLSLSRALSPLLHWHAEHLAVLFILNAAIIWAMSLRWQLILRRSGHPIGIHRIGRLSNRGQCDQLPHPGPAIRRGAVSSGHADPPAQTVAQDAAASVAADRLIEFCINCIVLLVGLIFLLQARLLAASATIDAIAGITILILLTGSILFGPGDR
jgi:CDP-diacylglycerol--glycerol-3-phosphate 3-phosphatidyltransferase